MSCSTNWAKRSSHISKNLVTRKAYLRFAPLTGNFHTSHICNWWDIKLITPYSDIPFNTPADAAILYLVALFVSVLAASGLYRRAKRDFVFQRTFLLYYKNRAKLFSSCNFLSGQKDSNFHCYCIRVVSSNRLDDVPIYFKKRYSTFPTSSLDVRDAEPTFIDSTISSGNGLRPVFMLVRSTIVPLLYFNELFWWLRRIWTSGLFSPCGHPRSTKLSY